MFSQYGSWLPLEQVIPEQQVRRFNVLYDLALEVALHCFQVLYWLHVCVQLLQLCPSPCDIVDCSCQAPLCMGFSRQEYWSGLLCPPPGDLPNLRTDLMSLRSPPYLPSPKQMLPSPYCEGGWNFCSTATTCFLLPFRDSLAATHVEKGHPSLGAATLGSSKP